MTQLTDKIREAIIGNVGTVISGRIGITDAEILVKKFAPTFDVEDLTKMPNYQSITSVMINNVPSAPFSMSFLPPMGQANAQLRDALKRLSAAKYGQPRSQVEQEIFTRLGAAESERKAKIDEVRRERDMTTIAQPAKTSSSFLDEWLAKRKQLNSSSGNASPTQGQRQEPVVAPAAQPQTSPPPFTPSLETPVPRPVVGSEAPRSDLEAHEAFSELLPPQQQYGGSGVQQSQSDNASVTNISQPPVRPERLSLRGENHNADDEVQIKLR
jgi:hypothetical protein